MSDLDLLKYFAIGLPTALFILLKARVWYLKKKAEKAFDASDVRKSISRRSE